MYHQGDIVLADLSPVVGHEQNGYRPLLIVSSNDFNEFTRLVKIVPITTTNNGFPLHLALPEHLKVHGFIMTEHERTLDLNQRPNRKVEECPEETLSQALDMIFDTYK
ncbi:type II toxin-antitoxin system PemK/MazF family toxin [Levilactobacillus bambusae]|uniref:Type II toxin-antitoxin system PemK/MazF family toxin n=2 Tax=Levilactobacillus bambusae TaxID=2024736 RepID=A0A2V1MXG6_9LACO|nr:type II toxin-antitoxin system PemK/MazF family toxin [Levilactobacillus bambusae]